MLRHGQNKSSWVFGAWFCLHNPRARRYIVCHQSWLFDVPVCLSALLGFWVVPSLLLPITSAPEGFFQARRGVLFCSVTSSVSDALKDLRRKKEGQCCLTIYLLKFYIDWGFLPKKEAADGFGFCVFLLGLPPCALAHRACAGAVFSSELISGLSPPSSGPGLGREAACHLSPAACRPQRGVLNPQRQIAVQIPREMKNVLLRLQAALFVIPI